MSSSEPLVPLPRVLALSRKAIGGEKLPDRGFARNWPGKFPLKEPMDPGSGSQRELLLQLDCAGKNTWRVATFSFSPGRGLWNRRASGNLCRFLPPADRADCDPEHSCKVTVRQALVVKQVEGILRLFSFRSRFLGYNLASPLSRTKFAQGSTPACSFMEGTKTPVL